MELIEIIKIAVPIIVALAGGGAIGAYLSYRQNKPKSDADAQKVKADVVVTFADGWEKYAKKLEERIDALEKLVNTKDEEHKKIIKEKDEQIDTLQKRVTELETKLKKYEGMDTKVEVARGEMHVAVDETMDAVKTPEQLEK